MIQNGRGLFNKLMSKSLINYIMKIRKNTNKINNNNINSNNINNNVKYDNIEYRINDNLPGLFIYDNI